MKDNTLMPELNRKSMVSINYYNEYKKIRIDNLVMREAAGEPISAVALGERIFEEFSSMFKKGHELESVSIDDCGFRIKSRRKQTSWTQAQYEKAVHAVCPLMREWSNGEDNRDYECKKCPASEIIDGHGECTAMCRLIAENVVKAALDAVGGKDE